MTDAVIPTPRGLPASESDRSENVAGLKRNARLAAIVDSSLDAIISLELEGQRVLSWNGGATQLFGHSEDEANGRSIDELIVPGDRRHERAEMYAAVSTARSAVILETVRRHKDGRLIPVELRASPIMDRKNRVSGLSLMFRDMSGRRAEKRLRDSEHRFSQVFDAYPAYVVLLDREGRLIEVNRQALLATGKPRDAMIGRVLAEAPSWAYSAEAQQEIRDIVARCLAGETIRRDLPYSATGGEMGWLEFQATPWFASDGSIEGVIACGVDITERKRAEAAPVAAEQRLRAFLENSATIAWLKDEEGRHVFLSRNYERRFGINRDDWIGKTDFEVWPRSVAEEFRKNDIAVLASDQPVEIIETTLNPDGTTCWWLNNKFPFQDPSGRRYVGGLGVDITERKQVEESLRVSERRLAAQKEALELAVSGAAIDVVLRPVAVETRKQVSGDARVALYIVDSDGARLRFGATAGMSERYTSAVDGLAIRATTPSCGKVAFTGERIIVEDVMTDPLWEPYRALAQESGFRACWSFPIRSFTHKILGTIAIYYDDPREPQQRDIDAIELLAQTAALIIDRYYAAQERAAAHEWLRRSESRLRLALAGARAGAWEWDARTDRLVWSPEMFTIAGLAPEAGAPSFETYMTMIVEEDRDKARAALNAAFTKGGPFSMEFRVRRSNGAMTWLSTVGVVEHAGTGEPLRAYGIQQDITERKRRDEQVSLLSKEVNHRAKNMLMLVQAIARQTAAGDPKNFVERFQRRIQALAANQDLLVRSEWRGVEIHDLARAQLAPFADLVDTRVKINGAHLRLSAAAAQAIGMALHELATNAGKYGALSCAQGCVEIEWSVATSENDGNDEFSISWREYGGPPVVKPQQVGLGSTMISTMAKMSLCGNVELDYRAEGVRWRLTCPAANAFEAVRNRERVEADGARS